MGRDDEPETLIILAPGAPARVGGNIPATVLSASVDRRGVQYKVAWWDGRTRHEEWLDEAEVLPAEGSAATNGTIRIGYRPAWDA